VDQTACVNLPELPLQLLLQHHPNWAGHPTAVVEADTPRGIILWSNDRARAYRIQPGMRYAAGLSLSSDLRAGVVPESDIHQTVTTLTETLHRFSPRIEASPDEPGVFWLDASGLTRLYHSLENWADCIGKSISYTGFKATVVVGFERFATYALARKDPGIRVLKTAEQERTATRTVPLDRLALSSTSRKLLDKLGIKTVGQFVDLPADAVAERFDADTRYLHQIASGRIRHPLQPNTATPPPRERIALDHPEKNRVRLMVVIERLLDPLTQRRAPEGRPIAELHLRLCFEQDEERTETIRPAAPTLDSRTLMELVRLRIFAGNNFPSGVTEVSLTARRAPAEFNQPGLFAARPARDLAAANRALARVRAELGDHAVVAARICDGHLPEARFAWMPLPLLARPAPRPGRHSQAIRRIYFRPRPFPLAARQGGDGWTPRDIAKNPAAVSGPYIIAGGWWRQSVHREYYFAETNRGTLLWIYYDNVRQRWFLQGRVE
jgi:protein ImuB